MRALQAVSSVLKFEAYTSVLTQAKIRPSRRANFQSGDLLFCLSRVYAEYVWMSCPVFRMMFCADDICLQCVFPHIGGVEVNHARFMWCCVQRMALEHDIALEALVVSRPDPIYSLVFKTPQTFNKNTQIPIRAPTGRGGALCGPLCVCEIDTPWASGETLWLRKDGCSQLSPKSPPQTLNPQPSTLNILDPLN